MELIDKDHASASVRPHKLPMPAARASNCRKLLQPLKVGSWIHHVIWPHNRMPDSFQKEGFVWWPQAHCTVPRSLYIRTGATTGAAGYPFSKPRDLAAAYCSLMLLLLLILLALS